MADERDPNVEPPNSTVDDWVGQQGNRDQERAEELLDETEGDTEEAERRFEEQRSTSTVEQRGD
jgi:hypothetical protein